MKLLNFDKVLCLSPHPDDVELSMFGTIQKFQDTHFTVLCMSQGTKSDTSSSAKRIEEVCDFWERTGLYNVKVLPQFGWLSELGEAKWTPMLDQYLKYYSFDAVFCPPAEDSHFEHALVNRITRGSLRDQPISLIEYKSVSTLDEWVPNMFVSFSENDLLDKYDFLQEIQSQKDKKYFQLETLKALHTNFQAYKKGMKYVEQYRMVVNYVK